MVPAFGVHPWFVREQSGEWRSRLEDCLTRHPGAGVGEVGLDHGLKVRDDARQAEFLVAQLDLARSLRRPITIHCRRAWGALLNVLRRLGRFEAGFVVHSYSGGEELIAPLVPLGAYFSFSGSLTFPGNRRGVEAAAAVPEERLLLETDAPDIAPWRDGVAPEPQAPNEPANLPLVAQRLAAVRGMGVEAVAALTERNARRLFDASKTGASAAAFT